MEKTNKKATVVGGLAMSLKAVAHKIKNGIPVQATARTVESYYRNLDLTDVHNMSEKYKDLAKQITQQQEQKLAEINAAKKTDAEFMQKMKAKFMQQTTEETNEPE